MTTRKLYVGPPHFKNLKKQIISGLNTTIYQSFKDILDYSVENSNIINIDININDIITNITNMTLTIEIVDILLFSQIKYFILTLY